MFSVEGNVRDLDIPKWYLCPKINSNKQLWTLQKLLKNKCKIKIFLVKIDKVRCEHLVKTHKLMYLNNSVALEVKNSTTKQSDIMGKSIQMFSNRKYSGK